MSEEEKKNTVLVVDDIKIVITDKKDKKVKNG